MKLILQYFNKIGVGIINFTLHNSQKKRYTHISWKVAKGWYLCLSDKLRHYIDLYGNVLTNYDNKTENPPVKRYWHRKIKFNETELYIDFVKKTNDNLILKIVLKEENEDVNISELVKRFNSRLVLNGKQIATITLKYAHLIIKKNYNDGTVLIFSKHFHRFLNHYVAGVHEDKDSRHWGFKSANQFNKKWTASLYQKRTQPVNSNSTIMNSTTIPPQITKSTTEAITYLNKTIMHSSITFSIDPNDITSLEISDKTIVYLDDTLRDILAFDTNTFQGPNQFKASDVLSLSRRINFFQIYSNISKPVRIGDVEAPILTIIPFNPKQCNIISERNFKKLQYVDLTSNYIPKIDINIYDDNGKHVPFNKEAITTITLFFRRKY